MERLIVACIVQYEDLNVTLLFRLKAINDTTKRKRRRSNFPNQTAAIWHFSDVRQHLLNDHKRTSNETVSNESDSADNVDVDNSESANNAVVKVSLIDKLSTSTTRMFNWKRPFLKTWSKNENKTLKITQPMILLFRKRTY